jgi:hypothetical protein
LGAAAAAAAVLAAPSPARADIHYDVGAQVGVAHRFLSVKTASGDDAGFGPIAELRAHLAVYPLVRVGVYLEHDISPISGGDFGGARQITAGGLHVRLLSPFPQGKLRLYAGLGLGYAGVYAPSYTCTSTPTFPCGFDGNMNLIPNASVQGSTGSFWEVPITLGLSYRLVRHFDLTAELGLRLGFAFGGDLYNGRQGSAPSQPSLDVVFPGYDQFAPTLTVGALFDL